MSTSLVCASCGRALKADAKFCTSCGASTPPAVFTDVIVPTAGERPPGASAAPPPPSVPAPIVPPEPMPPPEPTTAPGPPPTGTPGPTLTSKSVLGVADDPMMGAGSPNATYLGNRLLYEVGDDSFDPLLNGRYIAAMIARLFLLIAIGGSPGSPSSSSRSSCRWEMRATSSAG